MLCGNVIVEMEYRQNTRSKKKKKGKEDFKVFVRIICGYRYVGQSLPNVKFQGMLLLNNVLESLW